MACILVVFGTRPEAIKCAPLIKELKKRKGFRVVVAVTGQHREMLASVLAAFDIRPQYNLAIMRKGQSLAEITAAVLEGLSQILDQNHFDCVLVHGDTATAFAASLAAFYRGIKVGHIEAGLRTYDKTAPFPEEFNRRAIALMADYHFAPTAWAADNLVSEGVSNDCVFVTGNTGIDALRETVARREESAFLRTLDGKRILLLTAHRRENLAGHLNTAFEGIKRVLKMHSDLVLVYPVHHNPCVREAAERAFAGCENVCLVEPMDVVNFHRLLAASYLVLTDSGGVQEEAPYFGKPVLVLREKTERPEGVTAGVLRLVGCDADSVEQALAELVEDPERYAAMSRAVSPFGDGRASERIANILEEMLGND